LIYQIKILICPIPIRDTLSCLPDCALLSGGGDQIDIFIPKFVLAAANLLAKRLQVIGNFGRRLGAAQACLSGDYGSCVELLNAFYRSQFNGHSYPLGLARCLLQVGAAVRRMLLNAR
jgi:hypothetical protein